MRNHDKNGRALVKTIRALVGGGVMLLATLPSSAGENLLLHGKTIGQWATGWWQWQEENYPDFAFGNGGVDCSLGQSGPVWYLGGTGGGIAERECDAPIKGHKHLMFPLVNVSFFNPDDFCADLFGDENCSVEQKREILNGLISEDPAGIFNSMACLLKAEVDGLPVVYSAPIVRTQSTPFQYAGDPESVGDGYWVVLPPLARGEHTVHFTGGLCDVDTGEVLFDVDVTYTLKVGKH